MQQRFTSPCGKGRTAVVCHESIAAPIISATKASHIEDAVAALSVKLTAEEVAFLEEPYVPHKVVGAISNRA